MRVLFSLNKYFIKYKWRLTTGVFFVAIAVMFSVFPARIVRDALNLIGDNIQKYHSTAAGVVKNSVYDSIINQVAIYGALILLMALLRGVFMFMMRQTIIVVSRHIEYDMKNDIYEHYQKLSPAFFYMQNTGDLMNRISEDVSRVRMYIGPAIMYIINMTVNFIIITVLMFSINARLSVYVLLPLPVLVFIIYKVHSLINKRSDAVQEKLSDLSTQVQENFSGIRVLKAFSREKDFGQFFKTETSAYHKLAVSLASINAFFFPSMTLLIGLSSIFTIYIGGLEVINGNITIGNIAEFVIYVNMLTWPVASLGWVVTLIQRAAASQQRINEFLLEKPEIVSPTEAPFLLKGEVEFQNVSFRFKHSGIQALKNISFRVEPGKSIAFVGKTGSGKSTIANLLLRNYDITEGIIKIDGISISEINLNALREQTGYVPQDVFLFSDTIYNNIGFGLKDRPLPDVIETAAKNAVIYDSVIAFEKQFETMLDERGINLSGGQKQRISIARAIAKEPRLLIFDDCLSAVDTKTEEEILNNLQRIMRNRTTIIISHRVSSVKYADTIYVLDDGVIVEQGNHDTLIDRHGLYADMYEKQLLEEEV